jgi:hypothetical protein
MGWEMDVETNPKARKDYQCQASDWIMNSVGLDPDYFEPEDYAKIEIAQGKDFKILKGETYVKVTGKFDGEFATFRAIPDLNEICIRYKLYDDC